MEPVFLTLAEVIEIHRDQVERYGGRPGIRDMDLLQSAVAMPQAAVKGEFLHADLHEMAAAYLFHLVQNHAIIDGNKRVGAVAAYVFLALNGLELTASERAFEGLIRRVAQGNTSKGDVAGFFRSHTKA